MSGKVTSLPKVIKYVKRNKYSFHDVSTKHTPSVSLIRNTSQRGYSINRLRLNMEFVSRMRQVGIKVKVNFEI